MKKSSDLANQSQTDQLAFFLTMQVADRKMPRGQANQGRQKCKYYRKALVVNEKTKVVEEITALKNYEIIVSLEFNWCATNDLIPGQ